MSAAPSPAPELFVGLMSGTSMDGIDGVLVDFAAPTASGLRVLRHVAHPFSAALKEAFWRLNTAGPDEIHRAALAGNALARAYADVVAELLASGDGLPATPAAQVRAIGAHGQTVRHRPGEFDDTGYTVQINQPALLAELTGIDVVADFRSRDVAAGGQGAPLVPAFHRQVFGRADEAVAVLNVGGIANVTWIPPQGRPGAARPPADAVLGFDTGPGNALMDFWCQRHTGQAFDRDGAWAGRGRVMEPLLQRMLAEPYFAKAPPKSTGRDLFNPAWLTAQLQGWETAAPHDVQATLLELTVLSSTTPINSYQNRINLSPSGVGNSWLVCGGGALNTQLMRRLQAHMQTRAPGVQLQSTEATGLPPLQVEATAFAWLARQCVMRQPGSLPTVTGARGPRELGAVYPA